MKTRALLLLWSLVFSTSASALTVPPSRAGFPLLVPGTGHVYSHPAVADMKWTGAASAYKSIVFTSWTDAGPGAAFLHLISFNGTVWSEAPGFPLQFSTAESTGSPAVADLDGDGIPEIIVPYGSSIRFGLGLDYHVGGVKAYTRAGILLWDHPSSNSLPTDGANWPFSVVGAPAVADVDGDGKVEVAWGSLDGKVYLVNGLDGTDKPGWPIFVHETILSSPVLFDLVGDGKKEIVIGVDSTLPPGGILHVFFSTGTGKTVPPTYGSTPVPELPGFPITYDQVLYSAPAIGDIDGDGKPEIVFGTGTYWGNPAPCGSGIGSPRARRVYAVKCDGSSPPGWPVVTDGEVTTSPVLADLNGDGILDVVVTDVDCSTGTQQNFNVYGFKGDDGTRLFKTPVMASSGFNISAGEPVVADIFGDSNLEILVPTAAEITVFTNTGTQISPTSPVTGTIWLHTNGSVLNATAASLKVSPTASDPVDVIAASSTNGEADTQVWVWNPKTNPLPAPPWGMFRQNAARIAVAPGTASCAAAPPPPVASRFYSLSPCRAFDTRWPNGPFGGPVFNPLATRSFELAGRCGVPADARSVSLNVTATAETAVGYLTLYPGGTSTPLASTLNFLAGRTRANNAVTPLSSDGLGRLMVTSGSAGTVHVVLDVNGYFK